MIRGFRNIIREGIWIYQILCMVVAMTLLSSPNVAYSYEERSDFEGGQLTGTVFLNGTLPQPKRYNLVLFPDPYYCGRISDGKGWRISPYIKTKTKEGVPGVIVYLKNVQWGKPLPKRRHIIRAQDCQFLPYLTKVSQGDTIIFENWDPVPHDIEVYEFSQKGGKFVFRELLERNPKIRKSDFLKEGAQVRHRPGPGVSHRVLSSGPFVFRCSFHEYMEGWGFMLNHPYFFITGKTGEFSLTDIPPGKYDLVVWHPLGKMEKSIEIRASHTLRLDLDFKPNTPVLYPEDEAQSSPYGIDLIGDSQIVPTVERQTWEKP